MLTPFTKKSAAIVVLLAAGIIAAAITASKAVQMYHQKTSTGTTNTKCSRHPLFAVSPLSPENLRLITPLGRMSDSHVTPTDHQYWAPTSLKFGQDYTQVKAIYDVYSPADGTIVQAENHTQIYSEGKTPKINDWRLVINHSCGVSTIYIHIDKLDPQIFSHIGKQHDSRNGTTSYQANIPVKAGQLLGKLAEHPFDFSVHDTNVTLQGLNPTRYVREPWKIHTVDPFDYFAPKVRSQLLAKVVRQAPPRGGKIDYDIDGKLVGTWFRQGYNPQNLDGRFWDAEMTIAYNVFDPHQIFISLGNFNGRAGQFAVSGNPPDPKDVGIGQLVKYQVVPFSYVDAKGNPWNENNYTPEVKLIPKEEVAGTILYQLHNKSTLKLEIFVGQTAAAVTNFSSRAQTYER